MPTHLDHQPIYTVHHSLLSQHLPSHLTTIKHESYQRSRMGQCLCRISVEPDIKKHCRRPFPANVSLVHIGRDWRRRKHRIGMYAVAMFSVHTVRCVAMGLSDRLFSVHTVRCVAMGLSDRLFSTWLCSDFGNRLTALLQLCVLSSLPLYTAPQTMLDEVEIHPDSKLSRATQKSGHKCLAVCLTLW